MATTVYVGSARSDEYGKAHGGAAGVVSYSYDEASGTVTITNIADMSVSYDDESGTVSIG